jgi:hypothetical protein
VLVILYVDFLPELERLSYGKVFLLIYRERQDVLEQRWVAASRLNTLLEKRLMQQGILEEI